jgi:prephenate dehydrogenase
LIPLHSYLFRKITIIGVGLMGGSLGKAIKKHKLAKEVVGLSQRHTSLITALKSEAIDHAYHDVKKAVHDADLVVLATPVCVINGMLSMIGPHLKRGAIVTDVGSTKVSIVNAAQEHLPSPAHFVGSHPLAGSEKKGVYYASADLYQDTVCLMTPTEKTNHAAREKVKQLWTRIGCQVKTLTPEEHDKILAYVSHLPHALAFGLVHTIPVDFLPFGAAGLRDMTRIAASSAQMWHDIFMENRKNVLQVIDEMVKSLGEVRKAIAAQDDKFLLDFLKKVKHKKDESSGQASESEENPDDKSTSDHHH